MNRFFKRTAALLATAFVLASGAWWAQGTVLDTSVTASAQTQQTSTVSTVSAQASSQTVVLNWQKSDIAFFSIYEKDSSGALTLIRNTVDNSAAVTGLKAKTSHTFVVMGHAGGETVKVGEVSVTTTDSAGDKKLDSAVASKKVKSLSAQAGVDSASLSWEHQTGILSYEVYQKDADGSQKLLVSTYGSNALIAGLQTDKSYELVVKGKAVSGYSKAAQVTVTPQKGAQPDSSDIRSISIEDITAEPAYDSVKLSWEKVKGVDTYNVYVGSDRTGYTFAASSETDSVTVGGLDPETEYTFLIRGQNGGKFTQNSYVTAQTTGIETLVLDDINAEPDLNAVTLSWRERKGVDSYDVFIKDTDGKYKLKTTAKKSTVTVDGLDSQTAYSFAVKAHHADRVSPLFYAQTTTLAFEQLELKNVKASVTENSVTISWDVHPGIDTYNIYLKSDKGTYAYKTFTREGRITLSGLDPETEYSYSVKGQANKKYTQASYVTVKTLSIEQLKIKNVKTSATENSITFTWNGVSLADTYNFYLKGDNGTYAYKTFTRDCSITITGLEQGVTYTYCIKGQAGGRYTQPVYVTVRTPSIEDVTVTVSKTEAYENRITLTWKLISSAESYNIYIKGSDGKYKLAATSETNSATVRGLTAGTQYTFAVRAKREGKLSVLNSITASTLREDVTIAFEPINQLGGSGNSGKVVATYGCGGTSTTMLLNAKGKNLNKDTVLKKQYLNGWNAMGVSMSLAYGAKNCGSVLANLVTLAQSYGFNAKLNTAPQGIDIKRVLNGDNLVLVGLRTASGAYHFQIIYGYYTKNGVTYFRMQDPYGNYCVDWTEAYLKTRIYSVNMSDYLTAQVRGIMWLE
ncbi:MAG: C39 family peptidase [Ruminococcus sp.]|nr:C39 family peptidase [Ruminococcus sp.]